MLGPQDLKYLSKLVTLDQNESSHSTQPENQDVDVLEYDVNHLDYGYIEKCSDIVELRMLLNVLK